MGRSVRNTRDLRSHRRAFTPDSGHQAWMAGAAVPGGEGSSWQGWTNCSMLGLTRVLCCRSNMRVEVESSCLPPPLLHFYLLHLIIYSLSPGLCSLACISESALPLGFPPPSLHPHPSSLMLPGLLPLKKYAITSFTALSTSPDGLPALNNKKFHLDTADASLSCSNVPVWFRLSPLYSANSNPP